MTSLVEIDGSNLEGGGQILRLSMTFSILNNIPIKVKNIRAGRTQPGLKPQHLKGLELVKEICNGKLKGGELGSTEIEFFPGKIRGGEYSADTKTAGSIGLMLQVALPCCLFANNETILRLRGGTNTQMAPQFDYTTEVFRPLLERFGSSFDYKLIRRGYFPKGMGEVHIRIRPVRDLNPVDMINPGRVLRVWGWTFVAGTLPLRMAHQMSDSAARTIHESYSVPIDVESYKEDVTQAVGNGSGINLVAETSTGCLLGGSSLGRRELRPDEVGQAAAEELCKNLDNNACVDSFAQDQMIVLMAIARGESRIRCGPITLHTETAIHVAEKLTTAKFNIKKEEDNSNIIECTGIGLINKYLI